MMKRGVYIAILALALLLLVSCKPPEIKGYGKAIAGTSMIGPSFDKSSNDISDFPKQFIGAQPMNNTITFFADILATSDYNTQVDSLRSMIQSKTCSLLKSQNYKCVDSSGNEITGAVPISGAAVSGIIDYVPPTPTQLHYKCYDIEEIAGPTEFPVVNVTNQFGTETMQIIKPKYLCTPADKQISQDAIRDWVDYDDNHFKCYEAIELTDPVPKSPFEVTDQFETETLQLSEPQLLCTPAAKGLIGPPEPVQPANTSQHYKCYGITPVGPEPPLPVVYVNDQFGEEILNVTNPQMLCTQTSPPLVGGDAELTGVQGDHLKCYGLEGADVAMPKPEVMVNDQFGLEMLNILNPHVFCTPAIKEIVQAVPQPPAAVCGNGAIEAGEQCDDGNTVSGDGCDSNCQIEAPVCGNAKIETGEQCESDSDCSTGQTCSSCQCITTGAPTGPGYTPIIPTRKTPSASTNNVVAIGTCDDNTFIAGKLGTTLCNSLKAGDALIQYSGYSSGSTIYLIFAGKTKDDAKKAYAVFEDLTRWEAKGSSVDIAHNNIITSVGYMDGSTKKYTLEYNLKDGINFVGSPYQLADEDIDDIFDSISAKVDGIFKYDNSLTRKEKWRVYRDDAPSDLKRFGEPLEAYEIHMNRDATILIKGATEHTEKIDSVKDEYIGYVANKKKSFSDAFGNDGQYVTDIRCWDNGQLKQLTITDNPMLDVGMGCFIKFNKEVKLS